MDDAAAVGEARGAQDLRSRSRSRASGRQRRLLRDERLERAALEVLHRDVVGAVPLAAVVDRRRRAGAAGRRRADASRRKRSTNSRVLGEAAVEDLQRDRAAELQVLGAVDVGHAAGAEAALDLVAAVDDGVGVEAFAHRRRDSITALAIGAATVPPNPPTLRSIVTATATCGSLARARSR